MSQSIKVDVVTSSIKDEKDDIDFSLFIDDGLDPLDSSPLGYR